MSYVESRIAKYLGQRARVQKLPIDGTFELTPCCNMNCKMCYVRLSKAEQEKQGRLRSVQEWLDLADELVNEGTLYLLITGGEPFLIPDIRVLIEGLHKKGFYLSINTNGTLIDEETVKWLKQCPPARINITLYGSSNATYERLCQNPNGFSQAVKAIKMLKEAGIAVKLNCSLTPYNKDDLKDIIQFSKDNSIPIQVAPYMFPPVRKSLNLAGKNERFTPEETAYELARLNLIQNGRDSYLKLMETIDDQFPLADSECSVDSGSDHQRKTEGQKINCGAGRSSFWIDWKGNLHACGMIPENDNNVFEIGFKNAWEKTKKIADDIRLPVECSNCEFKEECQTCAAMVFAETASFNQRPEYRCLLMKSRRKAYEIVKEKMNDLL